MRRKWNILSLAILDAECFDLSGETIDTSHEDSVTGNRELLDAAIGLGDNISPMCWIRIVEGDTNDPKVRGIEVGVGEQLAMCEERRQSSLRYRVTRAWEPLPALGCASRSRWSVACRQKTPRKPRAWLRANREFQERDSVLHPRKTLQRPAIGRCRSYARKRLYSWAADRAQSR